ncbi:MAG: FkbM family methyltransferase [Nitrospina sp.]|jgi:FkbM family methyltransferase|nr:FkbM family methyltransferase [Nitrospina sp.]
MSSRLKYLVKSKSLRFVKDLKDKSHHIGSLTWNNKKVYYRTSSSDMTLIYEILLKSKYKSEYYLPEKLNPKIIFDIGGNIGITSIYLAKLFPDSLIYSFEPMPENFEILQKNISQYKNIRAFNYGLGSKNGSFKVYLSSDPENYGGISFYPDAHGNQEKSYISCEVKNVNEIINDLEVESIDLIKIDTEGAEYDILSTLKVDILRGTSWITGELHGNRDFELLDYLDSIGFSISFKKQICNRFFMFNAGRFEILSQLNKKEIKIL